ncbi:hypothetical protein, partial [Faecalicatena contorta]|uniref:hypothetical protein n=1 Tax=Faecalicatena contorta TaxID=39482 RepID=UPI001A9A33D5
PGDITRSPDGFSRWPQVAPGFLLFSLTPPNSPQDAPSHPYVRFQRLVHQGGKPTSGWFLAGEADLDWLRVSL